MKKFGVVAFAITVILNLFVVSSSSFSSAMEEMGGTLEVIMATKVSGKSCEPLYFINVGGKRTQFFLPARAPLLSPGQKIKISGRWEENGDGKNNFHCRKVESVSVAKKAMNSTNATSDFLPKQAPVLGPQNVLIVCLNSPDTKDISPVWTEEKINDKIFSNPHSLDAYWKECSGDKVWLTGDVLDKGNWKTMPKSWTEYGYGSDEERSGWRREFEDDMIELIDPEVDFRRYDGLIVFRAGKKWSYDYSSVGKRSIFTDEGEVRFSLSFLTENDIEINNDYSAHESGHGLFSLVHAGSKSVPSGRMIEYGDWWDNRGALYALLDGLHKYVLGWLDISQIEIITVSGNYWLDQRELASGGTKLLAIPLGFDYWGDPTIIYLEYHRGLGEFDSQLQPYFHNQNEAVDPNNLVLYREYSNYPSTYDSLVYVMPAAPPEKPDNGLNCLDLESKEFCDEEIGVCVQVLRKIREGSESQAEVKVILTEGYSFPTPFATPTPTPTPCEPDIISISPNVFLKLKRKTSGEATVTITSANGCAVEGETVRAELISAKSKKLISVSPLEGDTDENGQVVFTITAKKKTGKVKILFKAGNVEKELKVKVK